ncbi:MAG: hypothetical protein A3E81_02445 [Gammaproteobacteria bacterium RIFCSPHIGHO2_12_FULL_36_30]|nr:MAG: hypothetical protein A3E81_02445 [Gammaproteobacteria bacterium RIFCSPHIGHO2_12_FULL_36_30]
MFYFIIQLLKTAESSLYAGEIAIVGTFHVVKNARGGFGYLFSPAAKPKSEEWDMADSPLEMLDGPPSQPVSLNRASS